MNLQIETNTNKYHVLISCAIKVQKMFTYTYGPIFRNIFYLHITIMPKIDSYIAIWIASLFKKLAIFPITVSIYLLFKNLSLMKIGLLCR